jgi:glycerol kinase
MSGAAGRPVSQLRTDGGAAAMDLLLQLQADQCGIPVLRPRTTEVTALGAAMLAGLAEGVWGSLSDLQAVTASSEVFEPTPRRGRADTDYAAWRNALERSRHWERTTGSSTIASDAQAAEDAAEAAPSPSPSVPAGADCREA